MISKEVESVLSVLAEKFGTTVEQLWSALIRQAYIDGLAQLIPQSIIAIIAIAFALIAWRFCSVEFRNTSDNRRVDDCLFFFVAGSACFIVACIMGYFITHSIGQLINPEFWSIQQLFHTINTRYSG